MSNRPALDPSKVEGFVGKVLGDSSATMATGLAILGDRLGLFKDLAANGASTPTELAERTGVNERYAREWLGGMASAGYVTYDPAIGRFTLPPEHAPALAHEYGPFFFGGVYECMIRSLGVIDRITEVFKNGGGVKQSEYNPGLWDGLERFSGCWFENLLVQQWIPAMPDVKAKLESGARWADVGCGRGKAVIILAKAFPRAQFVGYDIFPPATEQATARAREAGVADRVRFDVCDAAKGIPEAFDVISTFDVVHDSVDPLGLLRGVRAALKDDGIYVCLDINCSDKLEENQGPLGTLFHGFSVFYCMTTSLAHGGAGLGTLGFHEPRVNETCKRAGFSRVSRVPLENPFNKLYEVRP